jgi:hypothetical protein
MTARKRHEHAPLCDALTAYHDRHFASFTVPGHKSGKGVDGFMFQTLGGTSSRTTSPSSVGWTIVRSHTSCGAAPRSSPPRRTAPRSASFR